MYCSKCGNRIDENDKFCSSCGNSIATVNDETVAGGNGSTPATNITLRPPYCTNCGESVGDLKICPCCHLKTKKNHKKYCVYCGGTVGENKKCLECGSLARMSAIETIVRFFLAVLMGFCYLVGLICVSNGVVVTGLTTVLGTLAVHLFLYSKKRIRKFKIKLAHKKAKKLILSLIYVGVFMGLIAVPFVSATLEDGVVNTSTSGVISYGEKSLKQMLKNPNSMQVHTSRIIDSFETGSYKYYMVEIDFSAQNGFGGYARKSENVYIRSFGSSNSLEQISGIEYFQAKGMID